ncbi:MAG: sigma-54 dependent transcriptional regulator [Treponema sp.]|jgi:two-component system response regulator AtoC|nr:sigma-54 dependent transcriptional regulator [Treponema sp.]
MRILIVDDERNIRLSLIKYLALEHIEADGVENGEKALEILETVIFDAVLLDLKLPGIQGHAVLEWIHTRGISSPVIMISAHGTIADAVAALKAGAQDYIVKPFDPAELVIKIRSLVEHKRNESQIQAYKRTEGHKNILIGSTPIMQQVAYHIDKLANTDVTVLITGESGTGKEVVAREIHNRSPWATEPFVAVNIGGIQETLMESELFGHEKGAFTGATGRKQGLFELAGRGCLFLDEIGEMSLPLQVKLLRVLQERKIRRIGAVNDIPIGARIISATNKNLEEMVKNGTFREDLYYRLNVFRLELPPLRERPQDIPILVNHILVKISSRMGKVPPKLDPDALKTLHCYAFPGNVRELENILERALIYSEGSIIKSADLGNLGPHQEILSSLESIEKHAIREALHRYGGNRTKAALSLGISRKTILNKIKTYNL